MVGQPSAQLESNRTGDKSLKDDDESDFNISEYLLLHHNYAAKPPATEKNIQRKLRPSTTLKQKYKPIRPKSDILNTEHVIKTNSLSRPVVQSAETESCSRTTTPVTLIVGEFETEPVIEITSESVIPENSINDCVVFEEQFDLLSVPAAESVGSRSPMSSCGSDYGYESLGSPCSEQSAWDQSITELFPSLL